RLAELFESVLAGDREQGASLRTGVDKANARPDLLFPVGALFDLPASPSSIPARTWRFTHARPLRVQPLLSPDNYAKEVSSLLRSAASSIRIHTPSLAIETRNEKEFADLLDVIRDQQSHAGMDVRLILRDGPGTRDELEALA